jgi:H+/gluconate symporter-like permease
MLFGIILSLCLLIWIAYKGFSVILFAPLCALVAAVTAGFDLLPTYSELFMTNLATYVKNFFPVFLLGAVFGKLMEDSGAARSVARAIATKLGPQQAIVATILAGAALTYGGISLFVVAFAVYPFAYSLFKEAGYPRRLIPGTIAFGAFGFTMTAVPGSPQIQNIIPTAYFHTDAFAAPLFGLTGCVLMFVWAVLWLKYRQRKMAAAGEGFGEEDTRAMNTGGDGVPEIPPLLAALPLIAVLVVNFILTQIIGTWDQAIIQNPAFAKLALVAKAIPVANWALVIGLIVGILLTIALGFAQFKARRNLQASLNAGAIGSLLAIMNTASEVGYGNIIRAMPGFAQIREFLLSIDPGTPLISEALTVNALAGITGSASGGMSIALEAMGTRFLEWGAQTGVSPELMHRVASMSSGGFDTMPHNGAVITLLAICGMTHKKSYPDICMTTLICPFVVTLLLIVIWTIFGIPF